MQDALKNNIYSPEDWYLSSTCRTRSGVIFDATADLWDYRDGLTNVKINFAKINAADDFFRRALKRVLASVAMVNGPETVVIYFSAATGFLSSIYRFRERINEISGEDFLRYKASQPNNKVSAAVRSVLKKWARLSLGGFSENLLPTLNNIRINTKNFGVAVATRDPLVGPFTDFEFESINNAIAREYADGRVSVTTYTMALIFIATGARPVQIAAMKVKDVKVIALEAGLDYSIDVPRAKQRRDPRSDFRNRPLIKSVGKLVSLYAEAVRLKFINIMDDPLEAPLFPGYQCKTSERFGFMHHRLSSSISHTFNRIMRRLKVISERTGGPINITAVRFRRTFATRAAQEGHGLLVIAELLDHSSTKYASIYIDTRPDIAVRIDKAVALELAPIAQAFEGKIIRGDLQATRKDDKSSHIRDLRISNSPLASCGQYEYCSMCAPFACYTCNSFEPWLDGEHEAVLDYLLKKRGMQLNEIDARVATVNDRTIIAVAQVVDLCRKLSGIEIASQKPE